MLVFAERLSHGAAVARCGAHGGRLAVPADTQATLNLTFVGFKFADKPKNFVLAVLLTVYISLLTSDKYASFFAGIYLHDQLTKRDKMCGDGVAAGER